MADVFHSTDMQSLLDGKYILFFGDSNMRGLYKDVITLYKRNMLISEGSLRRKLERSFEGDSLVDKTGLTKGRDFKEHRCYKSKDTQVEFFFVTKCLCAEVTETLGNIMKGKQRAPDVLFMNSTLWDITRWGFESVASFKENLTKLVQLFKKCLPEETLVIWQTVPPLSKVRRAFLIPEVEFMNYTIRFEAMEANVFAHAVFTSSGFDVLDFHHHLRLNVLRRRDDGVHWNPKAVRYMTNLFLTHISIAWERPLPGRFASLQLDGLKSSLDELFSEVGREPCSSASPQLAAHPTEAMEVENVLGEVQLTRIAAKDRLGEIVSPVKGQPQEDLRVRLKNAVSSLNTNIPNSLNSHLVVNTSNPNSVNSERIVMIVNSNNPKNTNKNGNRRAVKSTSKQRNGPHRRNKTRSRGPAHYSKYELRNQQNIRSGRGDHHPVFEQYSLYPRSTANWYR